jgi:hypothetical protein
MKRLFYILGLSSLVCACGGGGDVLLAPMSGSWTATSLPVGSSIAFQLTEQDSKLAGVGGYRIEAGRAGLLTVAGKRSGNDVALALAYDNGNKAAYAATLVDASHMSGTLAFQDGSTSTVQFGKQ